MDFSEQGGDGDSSSSTYSEEDNCSKTSSIHPCSLGTFMACIFFGAGNSSGAPTAASAAGGVQPDGSVQPNAFRECAELFCQDLGATLLTSAQFVLTVLLCCCFVF